MGKSSNDKTLSKALELLDLLQFVFQMFGVICIAAGNAAITRFVSGPYLSATFTNRTPMTVLLLGAGFGIFVAFVFMNIFDTVGDCLLYCWAMERKMNAPSKATNGGLLAGLNFFADEPPPEIAPEIGSKKLNEYFTGRGGNN